MICARAGVIGTGVGVVGGGGVVGVVGGGGIDSGACRTTVANAVCRDAVQQRFGHISSACRLPHSSGDHYLSVPDAQRKKCYKIPPENELCLCEDIFQQHQAKLIDCDVEDANAVESYKEPGFDDSDDDNVAACSSDGGGRDPCCCEGGGSNSGSESVTSSSSSSSRRNSDLVTAQSETNMRSPTMAVGDGRSEPNKLLTAEERDRVLRELDDIVTGNFLTRVRQFNQQDLHSTSDSSGGDHEDQRQQLTAGFGQVRGPGKRSSSLDTDEIINYGKVAELTRQFSRLGKPTTTGSPSSRHYCSEPNFFSESTTDASFVRHRHRHRCRLQHLKLLHDDGDAACSGSGSGDDDYEEIINNQPIRMVFISPMSLSDDPLNQASKSGGGGVILTEVTSDGEADLRCTPSAADIATQYRRRSFRKSIAFDSSLSSMDGDFTGGDESSSAVTRYLQLKGGGGKWQNVASAYSKSTDSVSVSTVGRRTHRRHSSVDVYEQTAETAVAVTEDATQAQAFLDVEVAEREFRDGLLAEKSRRREAVREYLANKELLLMKMKSASVGGGVLRWNQEHQDTLLDDDESPPAASLPTLPVRDEWWQQQQQQQQHQQQQQQQQKWLSSSSSSTSSSFLLLSSVDVVDADAEDASQTPLPKDGLRRVLRTGLKGRRIRRLRKFESCRTCSGSGSFALADVCRRRGASTVVVVDGGSLAPSPLPSSLLSSHCSSTTTARGCPPDDNRNDTL